MYSRLVYARIRVGDTSPVFVSARICIGFIMIIIANKLTSDHHQYLHHSFYHTIAIIIITIEVRIIHLLQPHGGLQSAFTPVLTPHARRPCS